MMTSVASLGVALYHSWKLTLILFVTLPISTMIMSLAARGLQPAIHSQKSDLATASKHAIASITAIDLVKIFNGYDRELWQYNSLTRMAAKHYLVQARCNSIQVGYVAFWIIGMYVIGFTYGVVLVNDGLEPGQILTTFFATLASFQGIEAFVPHWLVLAKGIAAGAFLSDLTSGSTDGKPFKMMGGSVRPTQCVGAVELKNVSALSMFIIRRLTIFRSALRILQTRQKRCSTDHLSSSRPEKSLTSSDAADQGRARSATSLPICISQAQETSRLMAIRCVYWTKTGSGRTSP